MEAIRNKHNQINIVLHEEHSVSRQASDTSSQHQHNLYPFAHIERKMNHFIGLQQVKEMVKEIYATHMVQVRREELGLTTSKQVLHMLFKGNPGTGKTTFSRTLASIYKEMNVLSKGHFIEAERADLVGEYIGQTAQKTRALVQKAMGGILFIDEAYALGRGGEKDFGKEAIDTLVKHMEDHQHDFVLVLAGYPKEMDQFLDLNPGLRSRFPFMMSFNDYNTEELMDIAQKMLREKEYCFSQPAAWKLRTHLEQLKLHDGNNFSNARYIRNIIEKAIRRQSMRLYKNNAMQMPDLMELTAEDVHIQ